MPTVKAGFIGAGGALALDAAWGYVNGYLPAVVQGNDYLKYAVKALTAIAVGFVGGKVFRGRGTQLAVGGMTVATRDFLKALLQANLPGVFGSSGYLNLGGFGAYLSGSAPIVGTATVPQAYLPFSGDGDMMGVQNVFQPALGAYMSGSSGMDDGAGTFTDDMTGY